MGRGLEAVSGVMVGARGSVLGPMSMFPPGINHLLVDAAPVPPSSSPAAPCAPFVLLTLTHVTHGTPLRAVVWKGRHG